LRDGDSVNLKLDVLGQTNQSSCVAYLCDGYAFIGSHFGDSQLIKLHADITPDGSCVSVEKTFQNLAPLTDFCVVDFEKQGQGQMVACSGAYEHGSVKIIRNGIGIEEIGALGRMNELSDIWALRPLFAAKLLNLI
jgi:DNA damage-binding protein 1